MDLGLGTYRITKTWNNEPLPQSDVITINLSSNVESPNSEEQLVITVEASFYDDPHMEDSTPKGTMPELWESEVVEVFLLGENDHYLEIEMSPKGQYLLLELKGYRNLIRDKLPLPDNNYVTSINSAKKQWTGRVVIPNSYLPNNIKKFNAYAIHGSGPNRIYKSLFPIQNGEFSTPDFHRLSHFGELDFELIFPRIKQGC